MQGRVAPFEMALQNSWSASLCRRLGKLRRDIEAVCGVFLGHESLRATAETVYLLFSARGFGCCLAQVYGPERGRLSCSVVSEWVVVRRSRFRGVVCWGQQRIEARGITVATGRRCVCGPWGLVAGCRAERLPVVVVVVGLVCFCCAVVCAGELWKGD